MEVKPILENKTDCYSYTPHDLTEKKKAWFSKYNYMKDKCCTDENNCDDFVFDLQNLKNECSELFKNYGHETNEKGDIIDKTTLCGDARKKFDIIMEKRDKFAINSNKRVSFKGGKSRKSKINSRTKKRKYNYKKRITKSNPRIKKYIRKNVIKK